MDKTTGMEQGDVCWATGAGRTSAQSIWTEAHQPTLPLKTGASSTKTRPLAEKTKAWTKNKSWHLLAACLWMNPATRRARRYYCSLVDIPNRACSGKHQRVKQQAIPRRNFHLLWIAVVAASTHRHRWRLSNNESMCGWKQAPRSQAKWNKA